MNLKIGLIHIFLSFILISANTIEIYPSKEVRGEISHFPKYLKPDNQPKPNLFRRLLEKTFFKKWKQKDVAKANHYAHKASTWGQIGLISLGASLLIPPLLIFSLIAGIIAISFGRKAIAGNTELLNKARSGKKKGVITVIVSAVAIVSLIILVAIFSRG